MSVITKDLGMVTAYAYAVSQGYEGTEEEFAEEIANGANYAREAAESATAAAGSASAASTKAGEAAQSATAASGSASTASTKASEAAQSATAAAGSATTASTKASEASGSASAASTKAGEASASATASAQSATAAATAKTGAETAQAAAETAQGKAEDAQEAAEEAAESISGLAEQIATNTQDIADLQDEKQDAPSVAGTAGQVLALDENLLPVWTDHAGSDDEKAPVIVASASGAIASFHDGADDLPVKGCTVAIEPVQDLHGQSNPYPAGVGANILPPMVDGTYSGNGVTAVVKDGIATFSGTTTSSGNAFIIPLASAFTVPSGTIYLHCLNSVANSSLNHAIENSQNTSQNINYGLSPANRITSGITGKEGQVYDRIRFYIGSGISISGTYSPMICYDNTVRSFAPYSNICPITGWTGANVARMGVNLLPKATGYNSNGLTNTVNNDNSISISGMATGTGGYITEWINLPCKIKNGTVFTIGTTTNIPTSRLRFFPDEGSIDVGNGTNYRTVTASNDITKFRLYLFTTAGESYNFTIYPQIELGDTASAYEPYSGTTIPVVFPAEAGTVYGGSLDATTGTLTVDRASVTFDGTQTVGLANWKPTTGTSAWLYAPSITPGLNNVYSTATNLDNLICDTLKHVPYNTTSEKIETATIPCISLVGSSSWGIAMRIADTSLTSASAINAYLAQHPITVVYKLAESVVYQLDPVTIKSLLGQNHIWSDTGDSTVQYCADTKMYIDNAIAQAVANALNA